MLIPVLKDTFYPEAVGYVRSSETATRARLRRNPESALALLERWPLSHEECREIRKVFPAVGFRHADEREEEA